MGGKHDSCSTEKLFGSLLRNVPCISDDTREQMLRATFRSVDKNGNGTLDKDELVSLMRKVMPTMSGKQVVELMQEVDLNNNKLIEYDEFIKWLTRNSKPET